jgi:hypothetical protein
MYLVILHPNNTNYKRYKLNRLEDEVLGMLEARKRALEEGGKEIVVFPPPEPEACLIDD